MKRDGIKIQAHGCKKSSKRLVAQTVRRNGKKIIKEQ